MKKITLKISGMHCTACAMDIDGELEDTQGVRESRTNYAKQKTEVEYNPEELSKEKILEIIKIVGYDAEILPGKINTP